jgi:hypothetical protein
LGHLPGQAHFHAFAKSLLPSLRGYGYNGAIGIMGRYNSYCPAFQGGIQHPLSLELKILQPDMKY